MKIVYNTILFTLLFLATSCDHSEKIDDIKLEISQNIFRNIDNNGGKITVAITSNSEWIIANSADWCIPDKYQGEGNDILTIKILANTKHANRQTNLIISAQGINQTIKISQQKGEVNQDLDKIHYQLPVIFHVLYQNENDINQYIKEDHLKDVLVRANHFYQSEKCGIDINLEFVLATKDKNGTTLPEPGVERVPFNELPIDCEKFMRDNTGKYTSLLWEPNEYINIMVYPFTDSQILGISTFPYSLKDFFLEGTQQVSASWITLENLSFPYCISINSSYIYEQSTDERIIMSLEDTYPEHTFSAINSFDNDKGEGLFSDEKGIKFRVHNLIYNNTYHFGCEDDYLATILNEQNYISQASDIATKYGYALAYDEENEIVSIQYAEDFQQTDDFSYYSKMVYEILNVVEIPTVVDPDTEFSTGEVNYYSRPCMGTLLCDITYHTSKTSVRISFEDKDLSEEQIQAKFKEEYQWLKETQE